MKKFKIALLCGGPSLERAISLNSARTILDHLPSDKVEILPVYFDHKKNSYLISRAQLYSNTPSDFDFKLKQTAKPLTQNELVGFLKKVDLIFPAMHGQFGEDGQIQKFLEKNYLPFTGSGSAACELAFDKYKANEFIKQHGFYTLPALKLLKNNYRQHKNEIANFFKKHKITRAIVKPAIGGSSLGVYSAATVAEAEKAAKEIFFQDIGDHVVLEPFCQGKEFTIIILENKDGQPVAGLPMEIELINPHQQIFDYRKKYLATNQVFHHCPPRFSDKTVFKIQEQAQELFKLFGLRDFARFDGWLEPSGQIWFSDFNPVSGMEQNSLLFIQSSRLGFSHRDLLKYVVKNACRRHDLEFPETNRLASKRRKKSINVIFGGETVERQVSVMSGTNVWLKLRNSTKYEPRPYLLDAKNSVWQLPYALTLYHSVEEIVKICQAAKRDEKRLKKLAAQVSTRLRLKKIDLSAPWFLPKKMTLKKFIKKSPYVFIGLHGGMGEDGTLQKILEQTKKLFNGSGSAASRLGMDKFATSLKLRSLDNQGIYTAKKIIAKPNFINKLTVQELNEYWRNLEKKLGSTTIIVKPIDGGCTAGIARLYDVKDLKVYLNYALNEAPAIPNGKLTKQHGIIEMPACLMKEIMFEEFIATDKAQVAGNKLNWQKKTGWIEITCGLLEQGGKMRAFNPSLTVALGNVLSLEEKFQGGTGINITPPPAPYVKPEVIEKVKIRMEKTAKVLGLKGYARLDAFMNIKTGELIIIEANTLPGLTPSTVIYHQALAENPPLYPLEFLEKIVGNNY